MSNYNEDDKTLTCDDCGRGFTFTAEEQDFFNRQGYDPPKRCPGCRQANKARKNQRDNERDGRY